jgi:hypothetical protein
LQTYNEIEIKQLKKQLKLIRGIPAAPVEHKARLERLFSELVSKTGLATEEELSSRLDELKEAQGSSGEDEYSYNAWFLRPLLSHLDHPGKLGRFEGEFTGIRSLRSPVMLHLPSEIGPAVSGLADLQRYFKFKSLGKGSKDSKELAERFEKSIEFSRNLPFEIPGITDLPLFHYNIEALWSKAASEDSKICIVSGICPLSIISDELAFIDSNDKAHYLELGFEPLVHTDGFFNDMTGLEFPSRPLLADYIDVSRVFAVARSMAEEFGEDSVSVKLWIPEYEYYQAMSRETFIDLIENNIIDESQMISGLKTLTERYKALIEAVRLENNYSGELNIVTTDEKSLGLQKNELTTLLSMDLDEIGSKYIPVLYGLYKGTKLRRHLYAALALKHFLPLLEDNHTHVLHVENSYEIWPCILAAQWAEDWAGRAQPACGEDLQIFSWLCTPSIPSPSLSYMRTLNAPFHQKIYLAKDAGAFESELEKLKPNYCRLLSYVLPEIEKVTNETQLRRDVHKKLKELNNIFT